MDMDVCYHSQMHALMSILSRQTAITASPARTGHITTTTTSSTTDVLGGVIVGAYYSKILIVVIVIAAATNPALTIQ